MKASHSHIVDALDALEDTIALYDSSGCLTWMNRSPLERRPGGSDLLKVGQRHEEIIRQYWRMREEEIGNEAFEKFLAARIADYQRGDGTPIESTDGTNWSVTRYFRTMGEGRISISTDITKSRQAAAEIERARQIAVVENQAKSAFVATMSHEIRTPLNGIIGMADLLGRTPLDPRQQRLVANVNRSSTALLAILNDILDFSKIEAGQLDLAEVDYNVHDLVADVADLFSERCSRKGLELVAYVDVDVPDYVQGDPSRLRQILINLVGNAVKFTERGEILVEVGVTRHDDSGLMLSFAVADTGVGIPLDKRSEIFRPFRQVDGSMTRSRGGTGLGLAICRQLVELMGGAISVEGEYGRGTTFRFDVQCKGSAMAAERPRAIQPRLRTLVVEAKAVTAHALQLLLTNWKVEPTVCAGVEDAEEAFEIAREEGRTFDVAIIDTTGLGEATVRLGQRLLALGIDDCKIIFLVDMGTVVSEMLEALNPIAILPKPIRASELFDCLSAVASRTSPRLPLASGPRTDGHKAGPLFDAKVLVVEDNPVNQDVAVGLLEELRCRVVTAPNGLVAARLMAEDKFDIVLMDCEMPEMDGFEATRRIRKLEMISSGVGSGGGQRVPIVALTAHTVSSVQDRCTEVGMDDFLTKPFVLSDIVSILRRWIGHLEGEFAGGAASCNDDTPAADCENSDGNVYIDRKVLDAMGAFKGPSGVALFERVVQRFAETAPELASSMRVNYRAGDAERVWRDAHSLRSSAATLGARRLSQCCGDIEALAKSGDSKHLRRLLDSLESDLTATISSLAAIAGGSCAPKI